MRYVYIMFNWTFGVLFLLVGLASLADNPLAALSFLTISLLLLPPVREFAYSKTKIRVPIIIRAGVVLVLMICCGFFVGKQEEHKTKDLKKENIVHSNADSLKEKDATETKKKQEYENKLTSDDRILKEIEVKLNEQRIKLKKYYATATDVQEFKKDILLLTLIKDKYANNNGKAEKRLYSKAVLLLPEVKLMVREVYASSLEEIFVESGMDIEVRAVGEGKQTLRIKYALMSKPLVYKFQNEFKIDEQAKSAGFSKLIYTNGFESSLGRTWTVDLDKLSSHLFRKQYLYALLKVKDLMHVDSICGNQHPQLSYRPVEQGLDHSRPSANYPRMVENSAGSLRSLYFRGGAA